MGAKLNAISLFSGIGGFELGLKDYCQTVLYCEQDAHAQAVLLSRMAEGRIDCAPICTDVREIKQEYIDIPIDIVMGGFPCQDISCAGNGAGLEGKRSGLFFEIVRLAKEVQPQFLFLENVPAIRTRGLDRVIEELTEAGYDCRWCMLSAADVGAKHKRERWFLLATKSERIIANSDGNRVGDGKQELKEQPLSANLKGIGKYRPDSSLANSISQRIGWCKPDPGWEVEPNMGGLANGLSTDVVESGPYYLDASYWEKEPDGIPRVTQEKEQRVERVKRLGNAVVPLQVKTAFEHLMGLSIKSKNEGDLCSLLFLLTYGS